ncbi:putative MFS-type transporter [Colletotrichum tanaceti]|nr:putative MFS-type transporter [Colletotrichum tanaceti]
MTNMDKDTEKTPRKTDLFSSPCGCPKLPGAVPCLDNNSAIVYRYLSFDTLLPEPADIVFHGAVGSSTKPTVPDLSKYTSPLKWPRSRKSLMLALSCIATFLTAYTAGSYSPPSYIMADDLGTSQLLVLIGITTFCVGFALSPMVLAPLSEIYGRYPVFVVSGVVYVAFQAVCSVAPTLTAMLIARFLVGVGGSVFSSVIGGVIADLWPKEQRNTPMALFSGAVLAGTGAGPLVASIMVKRMGVENRTMAWKWIFWHQVIIDTVLVVALAVLFKETRGSVILSRKAKDLNDWYQASEDSGHYTMWPEDMGETSGDTDTTSESGDIRRCSYSGPANHGSTCGSSWSCPARCRPKRLRWLVEDDEKRASLVKLVSVSVSRPFHLLFTEPVVFCFSVWCAFAWAVLYCTFGSIPLVLSRTRGMDIEQSGYFFIAMIVGSVVATTVGVLQDKLLRLPQWRADCPLNEPSRFWLFMRDWFPAEAPESRLYFTCITAVLLPVGLFLFGFTGNQKFHWVAPAIGIGLATWGIYSVYLATFNYFADVYHIYTSSALAAQSCCRNILGGIFPLVTGALFRNLGEKHASLLLGSIAAGLAIIPWALVLFGERIRKRSKVTLKNS